MIENRLACLNTNFQKRGGKLWTYIYANNTKAQIDYVFINKKWKNSIINCEAYLSFEGVSSDHRIVTAKIRLSLRKNDTQTATTIHYDWALLNNMDIRDRYVVALRNKFDALQEKTGIRTPNYEYENFVNIHLEAAAKYIPTKPRTKSRVPWETLAVREKRAGVKMASKCKRKNPTNTNALKLIKAQNELASIYLKEQTEYIQNQIDILLRHCNAVYNQNPIDRWMKGCILPFPEKGDLRLTKNYWGITLISIAAKICNALRRNCIEPKIDNILRKNQNGFRRNRSTTT